MADSRWRLGGLISTITFGKTELEIANILEWFALDKIGEPPPELTTPAQINQWKLNQAHREVINYISREARKNRLRLLQAEQTVEAQATMETQL